MSVAVDVIALSGGELVGGQYRVEGSIGEGGMGVVVAAYDENTGDRVAIKLLRGSPDAVATDRFFREMRTMSRLDTPHVVRVTSSGATVAGVPYIVMERLDGGTLADYVSAHGPLPTREVADFMLQVCEALSHAHTKGIVHRDIKPSNIFLHQPAGASSSIVKVLDFGISKVLSREQWEHTLTASGEGNVLGSPLYMSPEQVRSASDVDPRTDIWSLGVVMYRLLTGELPFEGDSVGGIFARILETPVAPSARLPPELAHVVHTCLAKKREQRYAHVGEIAVALAPLASPAYAAIASRIMRRMHEEGPTLAFATAPLSPRRGPDAPTLTSDVRSEPRGFPSGPPGPPSGPLSSPSSPPSSSPSASQPLPMYASIPFALAPPPVVARPASPWVARIFVLLAIVVMAVSAAVVVRTRRALGGGGLPAAAATQAPPASARPPPATSLASSPATRASVDLPLASPVPSTAPTESAAANGREHRPRGPSRRPPPAAAPAPAGAPSATGQQLQPSPYGAP